MDVTTIKTYEAAGMRTIMVPSRAKDVIRVTILADIDAYLCVKHPSLGALYAEMLMCGAGAMNRKLFNERLDALGAFVTASWNGGTLSISLTCTAEHLDPALRILKDVLVKPRFTQGELERAAKKFVQEYHEEEDDARRQAYIGFSRVVYPKNHVSYCATSREKGQDVVKLTQAELRAAHAEFHKAPWTIGISTSPAAGKTAHTVLEGVRKRTSITPFADMRVIVPNAPSKAVYRTVHGKINIELYVGNTLPILADDRSYIAVSVGIDILGKRGGFVGRLMSIVREKEGLTYSIYAWMAGASRFRSGHWHIWTFFAAKDFKKGMASTIRELTKICSRGVTPTELGRMKELLRNQFSMAHGASASMLNLYLNAFHQGFSPQEVKERMEILSKLTKKEIDTALRTYIDPAAVVISGAGPVRGDGTPLEKS